MRESKETDPGAYFSISLDHGYQGVIAWIPPWLSRVMVAMTSGSVLRILEDFKAQ